MSFDFEEARRRLDAARTGGARLEADDPTRILAERARRLAERRPSESGRAGEGRRILAFRRGPYLLGVPAGSAREVRAVRIFTVPRATPSLPGLFQLRGRIVSLVDVLPWLDESEEAEPVEQCLVAIVEHDRRLLGIRADEALGGRAESTGRGPEGRGAENPLIRTVTDDLVHVLDLEHLFAVARTGPGEPGRGRPETATTKRPEPMLDRRDRCSNAGA